MKYRVELANDQGCVYDRDEFNTLAEAMGWARRRTQNEYNIKVCIGKEDVRDGCGGDRYYYANNGRLTKDRSYNPNPFKLESESMNKLYIISNVIVLLTTAFFIITLIHTYVIRTLSQEILFG
jgi:hypothetical protein